jgi:tetratricopeptide (TPR) repeat protein
VAIPRRLVEVWAESPDGHGQSGSGWVLGQIGVLTARHVLRPYVDGATRVGERFEAPKGARVQVRLAEDGTTADWMDCALVWQNEDRDLALLEVTPGPGQPRPDPNEPSPRLAAMGIREFRGRAVGFPDAEVKPSGLRKADEPPGSLRPASAARDERGLVSFDIDGSVPETSALWSGFSGSAVFADDDRLIGVVAEVEPQHQQRRLLVAPIEHLQDDEHFAATLRALGADPVIEAKEAPLWRGAVKAKSLSSTGIPLRVEEVTDLGVFGVHARASNDPSQNFGYIERTRDKDLDDTLAKVTTGGPRLVLIVGNSAAGKSRSGAEALRRNEILRQWRLVVPLQKGGFTRLTDEALALERSVLWLDDIDKHLGAGLDLELLQNLLGAEPSLFAVATIRSSQLEGLKSDLAVPACDFLTDPAVVTRVELPSGLDDAEFGAAESVVPSVLLDALHEGVGLGEWLVGGPALMERLRNGSELQQAFAYTVIAWSRAGMIEPLAPDDGAALWEESLPVALRNRYQRRTLDERRAVMDDVIEWTTARVVDTDLSEQALVLQRQSGFLAHDYVADQVKLDPHHPEVPDSVWEMALAHMRGTSASDWSGERLWAIGTAAFNEGAFDYSLSSMRALSDLGDVRAALNVGIILGQLERPTEEIAAYDDVAARYGNDDTATVRELAATALFNKGVQLGQLDLGAEAIGAYDDVAARYGDDDTAAVRALVARTLLNKGVQLGQLDRGAEEIGAYDDMAARYGDDDTAAVRALVAMALFNKGVRLGQLDRGAEEIGAYDDVAARYGDDDTADIRALVAMALFYKGVTLGQLNRGAEAIAAYDDVAACYGHDDTAAVRKIVGAAQELLAQAVEKTHER